MLKPSNEANDLLSAGAPALTEAKDRAHALPMSASPTSKSLAPRQIPVRRFPALAQDAADIVIPHRAEDFAIDPDALLPDEIELFVPLSDRSHYRILPAQSYGAGTYEFCVLADGFFVQFGDMDLRAPSQLHMSAPDILRVRVASMGDGEYVPANGEPLSMEGPNTLIVIEPAGQAPAEATFAGRHRCVHVYLHREALKTLFSGGERELPQVLQDFMNGDLKQTVTRALPVSASLLRAMEDVLECVLEERRRRLFLQAKSIEIVCHALEALEREDGFGSADASILTARGVLKAQELLKKNFVAPPSLEDLAHEVGLSRSGLAAGFRQILGRTVFDYIHDLRMEQALALLNERSSSITQIAYAVGYNHVSSFSAAVQRRFGATPSELRRRSGA